MEDDQSRYAVHEARRQLVNQGRTLIRETRFFPGPSGPRREPKRTASSSSQVPLSLMSNEAQGMGFWLPLLLWSMMVCLSTCSLQVPLVLSTVGEKRRDGPNVRTRARKKNQGEARAWPGHETTERMVPRRTKNLHLPTLGEGLKSSISCLD